MAWSAVASAVTTIGNLLTQEGIYLWGVEEQVDRLQTELKWMQSSLIEADAKQSKDERIRLWVAEIRELAYDAENVVEDFALKIGSKRKPGFSNCIKRSACILKEGRTLHETRSKIEKLIARISDLIRRLQAYGIKLELRDGDQGSSSSTERRESRRPYPHIVDDNIVGLDGDIKKLVSVLVDEESDCSRVVSICGMGGLGKTTLAKKIYRHSQVIDHFNRLAWVYVSQQFQKRKVWEDILSGLKILDEADRKKGDEDIAEKLSNFLEGNKCLVILDDIWSIQAWDSLKPAFPEKETNSKILLTSRNKEVVSHADSRGYLHELRCLQDEESWELFQKIAFPQTYCTGLTDDDIKELVSVLVDEKTHCRVVSICGMGGLGKTTLAKKIYRHSQVIRHFNRLAWVYVSQQCQKRKIWEDILSGLNNLDEADRKKRDEEIAEKLFNFLEGNKCLVILDDIWSDEAWDSLKPAFPAAGGSSSKILLTSRNKEIVSHADSRGYLYELRCLKDDESWELFRKIAFPQTDPTENRVDARMEELGKDMVKRCAGLPLAIIVLGGILATKCSLNEWQMVFENVESYLKRGKGQGTEDVLALSYDDLPPYLRPCFLYLSHFPEDYEIHVDRLIQLWVAEGIVSSKQEEGDGGEIAEDVAESYLIELVERCMIQVRQRDVSTLKIKTFQMHDLMRDLCLSKAKQENFLFIVEQSNACSLSTIRRVRRVSAHEAFWIQCIKSPNLRSLLFLNMAFSKDQGGMKYMFNNFKLLRVLNYEEGLNEELKLPSNIGNLIHLRFLSLRGLIFLWSKLPSSLGNLRCLQTLDLRVDGTIHVPNVIWRMEQLRHLYLPGRCKSRTKLKLGTLKNLQTLVNFNTKSCYVEDLINMKNIRELKIRGPFNIEDFNEEDLAKNPPIIESKYLHSLSIFSYYERIDPRHLAHLLSSCDSICKLSLKVEISKLPESHYLSSNIAYIHLERCELEEDPMPTLEKLPNLRILELHDGAFTGKEMLSGLSNLEDPMPTLEKLPLSFPKLDSLSLRRLSNLEDWKVDEGAMPALHHLEIVRCDELKMLPDGLRFITTLQELKIESMPKAFKDKVVEGGEDFYKVKHVPSIIFQNCYY